VKLVELEQLELEFLMVLLIRHQQLQQPLVIEHQKQP
jgi:hypothetical protein